jgi:hypothetical protein
MELGGYGNALFIFSTVVLVGLVVTFFTADTVDVKPVKEVKFSIDSIH